MQVSLPLLSSGLAMLMSPNKGETAVHGCHCRGDMVVHMHKVLAMSRSRHVCFRAWFGCFMKRIDSFFKKCNTPKKKLKPDPSKPNPSNPLSAEWTSDSSSYLAKVARHFHPEWKATFPWVYFASGKMVCHTFQECPQKSKSFNDSSSFVYQVMTVG